MPIKAPLAPTLIELRCKHKDIILPYMSATMNVTITFKNIHIIHNINK